MTANFEKVDHREAERLVAKIFEARGATAADARLVAQMLVKADLMGLHSHGMLRVPQYVKDIEKGRIVPDAEVAIEEISATSALLDGNWNFGQVGGSRAAAVAIDKAVKMGTGSAALRRCCHVGRLGAFVELAARKDCVAIACAGAAGDGHWVAPFGGREGRLGTNPLAFGAPTEDRPIVVDFATSSLPEGKVRFLRETGQALPDMTLVDEQGRYSTNPADLYASDGSAAGAILPFGGPLGYKSYGISLMVQVLSSLLGPPAWADNNEYTGSNNLFFLALHIDSFLSVELFCKELQQMSEYVVSSVSAVDSDGVKLPGQLEFDTMEDRLHNGIPLSVDLWSELRVLEKEISGEV